MGACAVFLDRDGVLVETFVRENRAYAATRLEDFRLVDNAAAEMERLCEAGLAPIVVTNQPDVARGLIAPETLATMHARLAAALPLLDIFVCTHDASAACACRKPKPGLLEAAAAKWDIDLQRSFMVGDRGSDVEAGRAAGCRTILIERPYSGTARPDARVASLANAVDVILSWSLGRGLSCVK
jgi:D-glycero-D-manno-heptose 1,7-bisphosphate phosphatase